MSFTHSQTKGIEDSRSAAYPKDHANRGLFLCSIARKPIAVAKHKTAVIVTAEHAVEA